MHSEFDVAICGYGPTGLTLAALLTKKGHRVCVFERWPTLYGQPRMATIDGETARIIQNAADPEAAFVNSVARPRYIQANEAGQVLIDHDWDRQHVCGFPFRISLHQPDIEDAMDAAVRANGGTVNQGWELRSFEQDASGVAITGRMRAHDGTLGVEQQITAKYLVGADGARSTVRQALGIKRESWPFRDAWLTFDATRKRELPNLLGLSPDGRIAVVVCAPEGRSHSVIPLGLNHLRFNFRIDPDTPHDGTLRLDEAYRRIGDVYGLTEDDIDVYREALYPFEGKLAQRWRVGRVFLAGDAAHLMTPFYGQGGCSGLRDAANLAWKLDLVLAGKADARILDTYESERLPHVRVHIDNSDQLGAIIFIRDPEAARERDRLYLTGNPKPPKPDPSVDTGIVHRHRGHAMPPTGTLAPQGWVKFRGREGRFDDIAGWGFQVITVNTSLLDSIAPRQRAFLESVGGTVAAIGDGTGSSFVDLHGVYRRYLGETETAFIVARPDFVVYGAGRGEAELGAVLDTLENALGHRSINSN